jgi:hypothetical protein
MSCPAMPAVGLSRRYRVMPGGIRWAAGRMYLGWLVPALYRCRALVRALGPGAQGRPAASGEGADDGGCRMFLRVHLLLRRSRGRVPRVRGGRDPDGRAGVRRHRARPAGAAQPCSGRARARRAGGDLVGMGGADPGSPPRHRDERQHIPGRDQPGEPTLAVSKADWRRTLIQVRRRRPPGRGSKPRRTAAARALEGRLLGRYSEAGTGRWLHEYSPWSAPGMRASAADRTTISCDPAGDHIRGVSAEAACAIFHKALPRKRALLPR